jgi:predicted ester cyclase
VKDFWASYNLGDLERTWETYVAENAVVHPRGRVELNRGGWLADERALWAAFEDIHVQVPDQIAEGDMVASRWWLTACQTADFLGVTSQGRTATLTGILLDRVRDDKITEHWAELDLAHFIEVLSAE